MIYVLLRVVPLAALAAACCMRADADEMPTYTLLLKDHKFTPSEIHVASGKPFVVVVTNATGEADEFEMLLPAVETGLAPGEQRSVRIRPLAPGRFPFFGESDPDSEKGAFISE